MSNYFRIFGAGEWGLALANHLTKQGNLVEVYIRNSKKYLELNNTNQCNNLKIKFNNKATFNLLSKKTTFNDLEKNFKIYNIIATSSSGFADIIEKHDGFIINPITKLNHSKINTFGDHRIAMAFAIAGLLTSKKNTLDDTSCIDISFPEFFQILENIIN